MIFGRYTDRHVAAKRARDNNESPEYKDWWQVREIDPPAHLSEYRYAVVFEAPASAPLVLQPPCSTCEGNGEVYDNPAWPDPRGEDVHECPDCRGTGVRQPRAEAA